MSLELLFLGTGTSAGIPMIGCECDVCTSSDPRDQRTRPSVLISYPDAARAGDVDAPLRRLLIDTGPDMRVQIIRQRIHRIDGVFYTHAHADHIFGLDDLRRFNAVMGTPIDIYTEAPTLEVIQQCFFYIFNRHRNVNQTFIPDLIPRMVEPGVPLELYGARWTPLRLLHGRLPILGLRVDYPAGESGEPAHSLAYCTDVSSIPPETYPLLHNLDVLVIDGLRYRHHPTHLSVDQAIEQIDQIRPRRAYLTHMAHDVRHADLESKLPDGVFLSYDGLKVTVESGGR